VRLILSQYKIQTALLAAIAALLLNATVAFAAGAVYALQADGLACPFCAYGIEKQLGRINGVEDVTTDIASGTVTVVMEDGATLDRQSADNAVTAAGFTLSGFSKTDTGR
jgi:copper chaperone CopZ